MEMDQAMKRAVARQRITAFMITLCFALWAQADQWALLVGVNEYPGLDPRASLAGCMNDVEIMHSLLISTYGFRSDHVMTLLNGDATSASVPQAWRSFLVARSKPGDKIVFYYSGHGFQAPDDNGDEEDGLDESLVLHDAILSDDGVEGILRDDALGELTALLNGRDVTVVLDCCHSGTGIRSIARVRSISLDDFRGGDATRSLAPSAPRGRSAAGDDAGSFADLRDIGSHVVLLAACQPHEVAVERQMPVAGRLARHGVFTASLWELEQRATAAGKDLTYADVRDHLAQDMPGSTQRPSVEAPQTALNSPLFGGRPAPAAPSSPPLPPASPAGEDTVVTPLAVAVAPEASFVDGTPAPDTSVQRAIAGLVTALDCVQLVSAWDDAEAGVFYRTSADNSRLEIGLLLRDGSVALTETMRASAAELPAGIRSELERVYLVTNLRRLRSPDSGITVQASLLHSGDPRLGDPIAYRITSERSGYLTVINVDARGGAVRLLPNEYAPVQRIEEGESITIPSPDAPFVFEVQEPLGEECLKAIVTDEPLDLPSLTAQGGPFASLDTSASSERFLKQLYRAAEPETGVRGGFAELGRSPFSEATLYYRTVP